MADVLKLDIYITGFAVKLIFVTEGNLLSSDNSFINIAKIINRR